MKENEIKSKDVIFVGSLYPEEIKENLKKQSIGLLGNANDLFQKNLIKGLEAFVDNLSLVNFPNLGSFPKRYKRIFVPSFSDDKVKSYGFINLPVVKQASQLISLLGYFFMNRKNNIDLIVFYDLYSVFLFALPIIRFFNKDAKICFIVPDLPNFTGDGFKTRLLSRITNFLLKTSRKHIDFYSLITKSMSEKLSIEKNKSIVIEGLYDTSSEALISKDNIHTQEKKPSVIVYSGSLDDRNGVHYLIDAFEQLTSDNVQLHIYGDGNLRPEIESLTKRNKNVMYYGQVDNKYIINSYQHASILVNPRMPDQEFTKYSFPSKTMEYLASGNPVVMYRLPGVPDEYFDYVYVPSNLSVESLAKTIDSVLSDRNNDVKLKSSDAREFILKEKSSDVQAYKLLSLIFNHKV